MNTMESMIALLSAGLPLLGACITFLVKFVKNAKAKKFLEGAAQVTGQLQELVEKAETYKNFSGEEKKQYVMTRANQFALENGISFDEETVSESVERLVAVTKRVNARESDKKAAAVLPSEPVKSL